MIGLFLKRTEKHDKLVLVCGKTRASLSSRERGFFLQYFIMSNQKTFTQGRKVSQGRGKKICVLGYILSVFA